MQKITWRSEVRKVKDLVNYKENPRTISKEKELKLEERIRERGHHAALVIDTDNIVLSGNQRKKILEKIGVEEVTVLIPNRKLTEDERRQIALESNINDGEWDVDKLQSFKLEMLTDIGFDKNMLLDFWNKDLEVKEEEFDEKKELQAIKVSQTKLGDIIELGSHRIICGDSTDPNVLQKLFGSNKASTIYADPIYNLRIDYNKGISGNQNYGGNVNDNRTDDEYKNFIRKSIHSALSVCNQDVHVFYWCDSSYIWLFQSLYQEFGIKNRRVCLWIKNSQSVTPSVSFNKCFEPCVYGTKNRPFLNPSIHDLNEVMNKEMGTGNNLASQIHDQMDLWVEKRLSAKDYEHATSKPPRLHEKAIRRCTNIGDIILDPFLGSGSTLIAAEQLKRRVFGAELEPIFCDLIIRRFEKLTSIKAKIIRNHEAR